MNKCQHQKHKEQEEKERQQCVIEALHQKLQECIQGKEKSSVTLVKLSKTNSTLLFKFYHINEIHTHTHTHTHTRINNKVINYSNYWFINENSRQI